MAQSRWSASLALTVVSCALAPLYVVRWHVGPIPTTTLELALLGTFAVFAVETWLARERFWRPTPFDLPAFLFLLAGMIGVLVSPEHLKALGIFKAYLAEPVLFFYVLVRIVRTRAQLVAVLGGLAVGGIVVIAANLATVAAALAAHRSDIAVSPPVALYLTANAVALFLVPLLAVAAAIALFEDETRLRLGAAGFAVLATAAVLFSFSRGGYLGLLALLTGLAVAHPRRLILLAAGAVGASAALLVPPIAARIGFALNPEGPHSSLPGRLGLWAATLQMLRDHPLFGAGLFGFATVVAAYHPPPQPDPLIYPHNIVLNFWSELGLLGLVAFGWILLLGFLETRRGREAGSRLSRAVSLGVGLALFTMVAHGLVDVPYWKNDLSLEFWALLGVQRAATRLMA